MAVNAVGGVGNVNVEYYKKSVDAQRVEETASSSIAVSENTALVIEDDGSSAKLIGISPDGDTAKASVEAISSLKEGFVFNKTENKAVIEEGSVNEEEKIGSLNGFSSNQLEAMYHQGRISKKDYDSEVDRRDRITEQLAEDNAIGSSIIGSDKPSDSNADSNAYKAVQTSDIKTDADSMKSANSQENITSSQTERKKTLVTEEIEQFDKFLSQMNQIEADKENITLREENIQEVFDNERVDIMNQIYNPDAQMKIQFN